MIWWILLAVLVLLLILPLGVSVNYDEDGVVVKVTAGPVRFTVFPMKKKDKADKKKEEPKKEEPRQEEPKAEAVTQPSKPDPFAEEDEEEPEPPAEKKGGSVTDFLPLVELALKFVGEFFHRTLHIDVLYLKLTMAGGDPADLGINYGRAWAALGNLWPHIDRMLTIKKRDIRLQCDFEGSQTLVNARVDITVTLARLFGLIFNYGFRIGFRFLKIMFARNKAAKAESKS